MTSSKFTSDKSSPLMPLQSTSHSQILPYNDLEDLKEAVVEDRVHLSQQRNPTRMIIFRLTSIPAPENAHSQTTHHISHPCVIPIHRSPHSHRAHPSQVS
jgi:hypothetical protein